MDGMEQAAGLEEFGLSRYESRAYMTLVSKGTIAASELAYYAELPRTKVYPVLLKLQKKRLAIISRGKPITCTAIAPEDAFDELVQEQINKVNSMNSLVAGLKRISEDGKRSRGAEEKRYFHVSASGVLGRLGTMTSGTRSTMYAAVDQCGLGLLAECREQILGALMRNVDVRIVVPPAQVGSEAFKAIPGGARIRASESVQNCLIFDGTEMLLTDSDSGRGAAFSSADMLGSSQSRMFLHVWKSAFRTDCLADMTKAEAQEVCRVVRLVGDNALGHVLDSRIGSKGAYTGLLDMLGRNGVDLGSRTLEEVLEIIDSTLQIQCSGRAVLDAKAGSISVESKLNSGHSLPWASILEDYLRLHGYRTKTAYRNRLQRGEMVQIKMIPPQRGAGAHD